MTHWTIRSFKLEYKKKEGKALGEEICAVTIWSKQEVNTKDLYVFSFSCTQTPNGPGELKGRNLTVGVKLLPPPAV